jgi:rifampicin phosphotransferase
MASRTLIRPLSDLNRDDLETAGGKGANLGELIRGGFPVPAGFVVTTEAYRTGVITDALRAQLAAAYAELGRPPVAVRSSATAEDLAEASFAGQQDTYLNVRGEDALIEAVQRCWASPQNPRAIVYRERQGIGAASVSMAVVVQEMVEADAAGVMFTANPANGRREQAVISAAWGLGEAVVSGAVNTDNLVVAKASGLVITRSTADKMIMTGYAASGTAEHDVPSDRRHEPVLDDAAAAELAALGTMIEAHFGAPQDIEWARAGGEFFIVQSRPITALPLPEADPPTEWSVPDRTAMYVRASIVEQLPDPLTPLFADLIRSSVTRSLQALFTELTGEGVIRDSDVDLPTVNGYAYYRYSRSGMARLMLHSGGAFKFLLGGGEQGGVGRWRGSAHPHYRAMVERWAERDLDQLTNSELLQGVGELLDAGTEYYTSVQTIIPIAVTSEMLFTQFYDRLVRQPGEPAAPIFLLGFDSLPIRAEKSLYDVGTWVRSVPGLADVLLATPTERLVASLDDHDAVVDHPRLVEWRQRFRAHLAAYGHTVYNLDFANAVPADDPAPLIETLRFYLRGEGTDPHGRQQDAAERREHQTQVVLGRLDPARRRAFLRLLRWAQRVAPIREDALGDVGLAWPQMRLMLRELGRRLVAGGVLSEPDQIHWLTRDEVAAAGSGLDLRAGPRAGLTTVIAGRQEMWRGRRRVTPPQLLPEQNWMRVFSSMMPATMAEQGEGRLTGIGASAGRVTAAARVLGGPQDFGEMRAGDVLVASITTPAWTPLFALASGVVTDIGGPLSHSSIVAREYGIPAVLGTGVATRQIASGQTITVDGDAGTVDLTSRGDHEPIEAVTVDDRSRRARTSAAVGAALAMGGAALAIVRRRRRRRASI